MNKLIVFFAALAASVAAPAAAQDFEDATTAVENMCIGWNLDNILDNNGGKLRSLPVFISRMAENLLQDDFWKQI